VAVKTQFRTCPLCEATCGLEITMDGDKVTRVRGDKEDVFSRGFICPKGTAVKQLHEDPDRLRAPMVRSGDSWREVSWDEAFAAVERGLAPVIERHGRDAVALYAGNPTVHSLSATVLVPVLVRALGSKNFSSAATVDQMPKHVSSGLMFGNPLLIPVPDIDRTDYLLIVGANPWVSNGSLATAPDFPGRLEAIRRRGGKVIVVDPRRTKTAAEADEHIPIRPGADALILLAIVHSLVAEQRVRLPAHLADYINGLEEIPGLVAPFTPEAVAPHTHVSAEMTRRIARELADAPSAIVYDRVGAHQQEFGTLTSWASDVIATITGNLDRPGGKMFPYAAHGRPDPDAPGGRGFPVGRFHSRLRGYPEIFGQLPVASLAEEIETPGEGQVRALITVAGNPVLSTPSGARLASALSTLEFMISVDPFVNETTRFANVILPPPSILARHHYDFAFYGLSVRNVANYSPPMVDPDGPDEWEILSRIALVAAGQSVASDPTIVPRMALAHLLQEATGPGGSLAGRDQDEIMRELDGRGPVEQIVDLRLRAGPYGDRFGERPGGLSLAALEASPHGLDLGPLQPRLPNGIRTQSGMIELTPAHIVEDLPRLRSSMDRPADGMVLIGRRQLRSNNSWMHNVPTMIGGSNRCTLLVHPSDAERIGLKDGEHACIRSSVAEVEAPVQLTDEMMPGVVSLPHGWGHGAPGTRMAVARDNAGVSMNDLTDQMFLDPLSGNAVLNAIPVSVERVHEAG
jgi:anaerobic selenocysteine-containing dehydrogenase